MLISLRYYKVMAPITVNLRQPRLGSHSLEGMVIKPSSDLI